MIDTFLARALLAGLGIALLAGPLGAFVIWRRLAIFGEAVAQSALLGVILALLLHLDLTLGVVVFAVLLATALWALEQQRMLPTDTILSTLAHGALATGLVVLSLVDRIRIDLLTLLFGDILAVSERDLLVLAMLVGLVLVVLARFWRELVSLTIDPDLARVEGVPVRRLGLVLDLLIAAAIALGMKLVGILLVVSLLIVPGATARPWARTPQGMAALASLAAALAVGAGLTLSVCVDLPTGPAIVVVAIAGFLSSVAASRLHERRARSGRKGHGLAIRDARR